LLTQENLMRQFRVAGILRRFAFSESGVTLIETLVALALLGIIAVPILSGLATTSKAAFTTDERATAESLARSQMEWVKNADYVYGATEYSPAPIPDGKDYIDYSAIIVAEPLHDPDDGIQKIRIIVKRSDKVVITLEGYKVDR